MAWHTCGRAQVINRNGPPGCSPLPPARAGPCRCQSFPRPRGTLQVSVIPGPVVTPEDFEAAQAAPGAVPPRTVVCYCTAGLRSGNCAVRLRDKQQATGSPAQPIEYANLAGGILAWVRTRRRIARMPLATTPTGRRHPQPCPPVARASPPADAGGAAAGGAGRPHQGDQARARVVGHPGPHRAARIPDRLVQADLAHVRPAR